MPKGQKRKTEAEAYKHDHAKRKNNPEAGLIDFEPKVKDGKKQYCWDPRESPQLIWAGKAGMKKVEVEERASVEVPVVNLHIHERVSTENILRAARRLDAQRSLFADPELEFKDEIRFYQHDVNWSNRMILGDSLLVMNSLLEREQMRGKVQMIYMDPPYGIKYASNFQPRIDQRDVKDGKDDDLSREVEVVQAFRDTWELGVHSYLSYLRDRLLLSRELLADSGSIFVQIGDENVHRVRCLMDEVFGEDNFYALIAVKKTGGLGAVGLKQVCDFVIWAAKDRACAKYRQVLEAKQVGVGIGTGERYDQLELHGGERRSMTPAERANPALIPAGARAYKLDNLKSGAFRENTTVPYRFQGVQYHPGANNCWKTTTAGLDGLAHAERIESTGRSISYCRFLDDFPAFEISNMWDDTGPAADKAYVVQTSGAVIARCLLMATDPGDLVLDPTCGSGTTAYVAEQWGRRWITMDTSRVALAIARHRLMTGCFDYYKLRHEPTGVAGGFNYKTVPHITLRSIAQNAEIDAIVAEYQPKIDAAVVALNKALGKDWKEWEVPRRETTGDGEPGTGAGSVILSEAKNPDPDRIAVAGARDPSASPQDDTLRVFWRLKREMQAKIDASIQRNAPQEELVEQPEVVKGIVRVSGPFSVEAMPESGDVSVEVETETIPTDEGDLEMAKLAAHEERVLATNASAYVGDMIGKLMKAGVYVKGGRRVCFDALRPLAHEVIHAEGEFTIPASTPPGTPNPEPDADLDALAGKTVRCAVMFGPQNGSVTESHVRDGVRAAGPYDAVLFCGYDFSGPAQEVINSDPIPNKRLLMAHICPTTAMTDLLKDSKTDEIFTMLGEPDVTVYRHGDPELPALLEDARRRKVEDVLERAKRLGEGEAFVELRGVDLYNPMTGEVTSDRGENVHAVFVDHDYDGKSFCICQALFPNRKDSWEKIARNLRGSIDEEAFEAMRTLVSLPFRPGAEGRVQVKVIDARGNSVVKTVKV